MTVYIFESARNRKTMVATFPGYASRIGDPESDTSPRTSFLDELQSKRLSLSGDLSSARDSVSPALYSLIIYAHYEARGWNIDSKQKIWHIAPRSSHL